MWFRVDDTFYNHPKVIGLPDSAIGLWLRAGCWAARHLTDGYVPKKIWRDLGGRHWHRSVQSLEQVWLIEPDENGDGWWFHDWREYQPTRDQVQTRRKETADRVKSWRAKKSESRKRGYTGAGNGVTQAERNAVTPGV